MEQVTDSLQNALIIAEFTALKSQIDKRIELRQQLLLAVLLLAGSFLTLGTQSSELGVSVLCYPLLALFLAIAWAHEDRRIRHMRDYVAEIETRYAIKGWETHRQIARKTMYQQGHKDRRERFFGLSTRGIFVVTQLIALIIGIVRAIPFFYSFTVIIVILLLIIDIISMFVTYRFTRHYREK